MLLWLVVHRRTVESAVTLAVGLLGSTALGNLLTGGWYSLDVPTQLLSQSWALHWLWDFWLQDVAAPFAVSLLTVAVVAVAGRGRSSVRDPVGRCETAFR